MSHLRFQHLFLGLMALGALGALALPEQLSTRGVPQLSMLFAPVARPAGALAGWMFRRFGGDRPTDDRDAQTIRGENAALHAELASLTVQLEELARRDAERQKLGAVRTLCTPVQVVGADAGARESLSLRCSTLEGVEAGMCVLYAGGVVGQVERAGIAGAQVRLITDKNFRLRGSFGLFRRRGNQIEFARLEAPTALLEGAGDDAMLIRGLPLDTARSAHLAVGDWVILSEPDWPDVLQGQPLGKVTKISPRPDAPLFAQIRVEPQSNLSRLREVMVMTKER